MTDPAAPFRPPFDPFASGSADPDPSGEEARRRYAARIPAGLEVDLDRCFLGGSGARVAKRNQARLALLEASAPVLLRCLGPQDRVRLVASAYERIWWEMLSAGQWSALLNRSILVVTDEKLVVMRCDRRARPMMFVNQLRFEAVKKVGGFLANLSLGTATRARKFSLDRRDRAEVEGLVRPLGAAARGDTEHLCPACFAATAVHVERCASCGLELASPGAAFWRSLLVPGLGAWKLGAKGLGGLQMARAGVLWALFLLVGSMAVEESDTGSAIVAACMFAFNAAIHLIDALASRALARRGLIAPDTRLPTERAPVR